MNSKTYRTRSAEETLEFGKALGSALVVGDDVLLSGDLGTGKSVLARGIAASMGIFGPMPSPTFTIVIPYKGEKKLYHFDLYRLSDPEEFFAAGLEEMLSNDGVCVIEWPEMADIDGSVLVEISRAEEDDGRVIEITCRDGRDEVFAAIEKWSENA